MSTDREPERDCEDPPRRHDLAVMVGTSWRKIREAADDLRRSQQWG